MAIQRKNGRGSFGNNPFGYRLRHQPSDEEEDNGFYTQQPAFPYGLCPVRRVPERKHRYYRWEYKLVQDDQINAWCMPGGKIVVYTGILPITKTEEGFAVVLGHELCHALLNHGQQRMSAGILHEPGMVGVQIGAQAAGLSEEL